MPQHHADLADRGFRTTIAVAVTLSAVIIAAVAGLGRAVRNIEGALTEKPDLAVYLLLPEENVKSVTLLRGGSDKRDYLVDTDAGLKLVVIARKNGEWTLISTDDLRGADVPAAQATGTR
jgi:hypothetical protein